MSAAVPALERFDHVGIPTGEVKPGATYLPEDGVWITNPRLHAAGVEWVHHTPESRMPARLQREPHLAFRVAALAPYLEAYEVLVPPFAITGVEIAFVVVDGALVELLDFKDADEEAWVA